MFREHLSLALALRIILQILFGSYFLYEVGRSVAEYSKFQVLQVRTTQPDDTGVFPSVTVCPMRSPSELKVLYASAVCILKLVKFWMNQIRAKNHMILM